MTVIPADSVAAGVASGAKSALWLSGAVLFALVLLYLVGVEQGAVSLFGANSYVHEFMHDGRHLLAFPCH